MYAGGWITHAQFHRPVIRPLVQRQLVQPVYVPPALLAAVTVPPAVTTTAKPIAKPVLTKRKTTRILVLPAPLVALLVILTVVVCNAFLPPDIQIKEITSAVSTVKAKAVDPKELRCMSENIYFEAGGESLIGKMAVGHVVLNRAKSPNYPKTVCGVVHQKNGETCMFSWLCEGPKEVRNSVNWQQSQEVAYKLLSQPTDDLTEGSTHFHGMGVNPKWKLKPTVRIDGHQFYR
jgi:hypothetical protein